MSFKNYSNKKKVILLVVGFIVAIALINGVISIINEQKNDNVNSSTPDSSQTSEKDLLVSKVNSEIGKMDDDTKRTIASFGNDGYQGNIGTVSAGTGQGEVKINIDTFFENPDDGKKIARNIFNMLCVDVPELKSLYVTSSKGLDSHSIYRSESACKN